VPRFRAMPNLEVQLNGWDTPRSSLDRDQPPVKPLCDVRVRQAINSRSTAHFIRDRLWFGIGKVRPARSARHEILRSRRREAARPDPKAAMQLLDAAGLKPDAKGVRFTSSTWPALRRSGCGLSEYFRTALRRSASSRAGNKRMPAAWGRRIGDWTTRPVSTSLAVRRSDPGV